MLFKFWNVKYGKKLKLIGLPIIQKRRDAELILGEGVKLISKPRANLVGLTNPCILVCNGPKAKIFIGKNSGLSGAVLNAKSMIRIGDYVNIGGNVRIFDHDFHVINYLDRLNGVEKSEKLAVKDVVIEDYVFIGTNSIILKGSRIGKGSVIGAGSVVSGTKIPPEEIWGGNPARFIRKLK